MVRNGIYTITKDLIKVCNVYQTFHPAVVAFIRASTLTSAEQTSILALLDTVVTLCDALKKLQSL